MRPLVTASAGALVFAISGCAKPGLTLETDCSWRQSLEFAGAVGTKPVDNGDGYVSFSHTSRTDTGGEYRTNTLLQCEMGFGVLQGYDASPVSEGREVEPDRTTAVFAHFRQTIDERRSSSQFEDQDLEAEFSNESLTEQFLRAEQDNSIATCACSLFYPPTADRWAEGDK